MKNPSELSVPTILALAQAKIADPENWCQGSLGMLPDGTPVENFSSDSFNGFDRAVKWCALGAVASVTGFMPNSFSQEDETDWRKAVTPLHDVALRLGYMHAPGLNDSSTHEKVMEMFDKAIELAAADEKVNSEERACA
jgi:hypothetical protein